MFGAMPYILMGLGIVVLIVGTVYSVSVMRREQHRELDRGADDMAAASVRHPISSNPILVLYIIIPVAAIVGGIIWVLFSQQSG